ncbi:hypothetical protein WA026_009947 [Henosepilachna vigintioctopunctata]|uniref:Uncharacterized protein n=1 Tax=Henosepilachna vigintioctopunctata TaxID=420089 RepID=A0AAW1TJA6_9CUCU
MENDMANYYQYKMGFSQKIILKDKVLPSKFHCQPDRIKRMCDAGTSRSSFVKRQRMELVKQCEDIHHPTLTNDEHTDTVVETSTKELSQKCDKSTLTEPVVTVEKSVQYRYINKVHIRSKAVQTKSLTRDKANSPLLSAFTKSLSMIKTSNGTTVYHQQFIKYHIALSFIRRTYGSYMQKYGNIDFKLRKSAPDSNFTFNTPNDEVLQ